MKNRMANLGLRTALVLLASAGCGGCFQAPANTATEPLAETDATAAAMADAAAGIPVPAAVRANLGITFAKVEARAVKQTRRVPGQFELLPTARHEYRMPLSGRVSLAAGQFEPVAPEAVLFTIESPVWRQIQHEAVEAEGEIAMAEAALDVTRARRAEARAALADHEARLKKLADAGARNADLETTASALRNSLPRLDAEVSAQTAAVREAHEHYASRLNALSAVSGFAIDALVEETNGVATWRTIAALPVPAKHAGVVESLQVNDGGWLEEGGLVLTVIDPAKVRFRAVAPQTDIALYRDGLPARIVPPEGGSVDSQTGIAGTLALGLTANPDDRTVSLFVAPDSVPPWAKAGVGAYLEVVLDQGADRQLAVPAPAIIQDGLEAVFFRRNPADPDRVLRLVADLGPSDGRWTVLRSGVKEGDEVVVDGVYALNLTDSAQQAPDGYHYHADGALHKNH